MIRVATWNVNSLRARLERVLEWCEDIEPDVLCLQETKLDNDAFPTLDFHRLGYESAHFGQGRWNGVAIISRVGLESVVDNFAPGVDPDHEARIITATCADIRVSSVYVPNGRAIDDDHYVYKLSWMDRLVEHLAADTSADAPVIVTGDFNIAPTDLDVYDPGALIGSTHVTDAERRRIAALESWGLIDVTRDRHPGVPGIYSWWDYRNGSFHKGHGMRIDLVMASRTVLERTRWTVIDRSARKGQQPSDHAPVLVDLDG